MKCAQCSRGAPCSSISPRWGQSNGWDMGLVSFYVPAGVWWVLALESWGKGKEGIEPIKFRVAETAPKVAGL